ncbi:hypothetical protein HOY82DRAFT_157813 [Tuber indicum]|nr:hypothetical protein HOY82DRAFT_157813 [Tuber indicum]
MGATRLPSPYLSFHRSYLADWLATHCTVATPCSRADENGASGPTGVRGISCEVFPSYWAGWRHPIPYSSTSAYHRASLLAAGGPWRIVMMMVMMMMMKLRISLDLARKRVLSFECRNVWWIGSLPSGLTSLGEGYLYIIILYMCTSSHRQMMYEYSVGRVW